MRTDTDDYATRLVTLQGAWWKRALNVQAPYRWNIRRHGLGRTLDIGCGIGRNLASLPPGSVGVDHNATSVGVARTRGLRAMTVEEFFATQGDDTRQFDALLVAHVLEHLSPVDGEKLMRSYLPHLRRGGRVMLICPQERGYASDPTHVRWLTGADLVGLCRELGLRPRAWRSFPLPRAAGKVFAYNEFNVLAAKDD